MLFLLGCGTSIFCFTIGVWCFDSYCDDVSALFAVSLGNGKHILWYQYSEMVTMLSIVQSLIHRFYLLSAFRAYDVFFLFGYCRRILLFF